MRYDLYRFFDRSWGLLYVGSTCNLNMRYAWHRDNSPWIGDVWLDHVTYGFEELWRLLRAEAVAIRYEKPRHNIAIPDPSRYWGESDLKPRGRPATKTPEERKAMRAELMRKKRAEGKK